jgi:hypothetical protein
VEKRAKKIDNDMKKHTSEALAKKKAGDQRGRCNCSVRVLGSNILNPNQF